MAYTKSKQNEMIRILTDGIGSKVGRSLRIDFGNKHKAFEVNETFKTLDEQDQLAILDLLALTLFFEQVFAPISGAYQMYSNAKKIGVSKIQMSTYSIDGVFARDFEKASRRFIAILHAFNIQTSQLGFTSVREFVENSLKLVKEWKKR